MTSVYIGLGSNVGDKRAYIVRALQALQENHSLLQVSSLYETEPVGLREQDWYLNAVAQVETHLEPRPLLESCRRLETQLGRERRIKNGPRTIDIDLALFNREVLAKPKIPDPEILTRAFLARPLAELQPDYVHPLEQRTLAEIAGGINHEPLRLRNDVRLPRPAAR